MKYVWPAVLLFLIPNGCADSVINNTVEPGISISITKPLDNDSIRYRGEKIEYSYNSVSGMIFIELYVNNNFTWNYPPSNDEDPILNFNVDSVLTGQKVDIYLIYYDKNGKSTKSNTVKNVYIH